MWKLLILSDKVLCEVHSVVDGSSEPGWITYDGAEVSLHKLEEVGSSGSCVEAFTVSLLVELETSSETHSEWSWVFKVDGIIIDDVSTSTIIDGILLVESVTWLSSGSGDCVSDVFKTRAVLSMQSILNLLEMLLRELADSL